MDPRPSLLTAEGVDVARGGQVLLRGIDLALSPGEVVAVLGPNGVGKSSLLAVLAGLLPAAAGRVTSEGRVAAALQAPAMAQRTVQANVEAALGWWGVPRAERAARARAALAELGADELASRRADTLSGGEARRVHLARALAVRPDILLLDEPFAGLDPPSRAGLLRDAGRVLRSPDRATLIVLHDRAEAWALADRLIVLLGGRIAADGPPRAILGQPPSLPVAAFLGFTGRIEYTGGGTQVLRPSQVSLDPSGPLTGTVVGLIPEEDSVLCEVRLVGGTVQVRAPHLGLAEGDIVQLRADGGAWFHDGAPR